MSTEGIEAVFLETHNWGRSAGFFRALGFALEFETDHDSGRLRHGDGPSIFIAEIPEDREPTMRIVLKVAEAAAADPDLAFEETHYGTREATVHDPDGRPWVLQIPGSAS